jgi:hypothetical protein
MIHGKERACGKRLNQRKNSAAEETKAECKEEQH